MSKPLVSTAKIVPVLASVTPSTTTPRYVSLKDYTHATILVTVKNATTVTGSAITLKQATTVAGTNEKTLAFTKVWANTDNSSSSTGDTLTETAVTSNTFTTDSTNSKNLTYVMEVESSDLDTANGFDCFRIGTGDATAATLTVNYILSGSRYSQATPPIAITD